MAVFACRTYIRVSGPARTFAMPRLLLIEDDRETANEIMAELGAEANEPRGAVFQFTLPGSEREFTNALQSVQGT
jgi:hypothetical protein